MVEGNARGGATPEELLPKVPTNLLLVDPHESERTMQESDLKPRDRIEVALADDGAVARIVEPQRLQLLCVETPGNAHPIVDGRPVRLRGNGGPRVRSESSIEMQTWTRTLRSQGWCNSAGKRRASDAP